MSWRRPQRTRWLSREDRALGLTARLAPSLTAVLAAFCLLGTAEAQPLPDGTADGSSVRFHLHQSFKPCGKKWAKRAARLPREQLSWMLSQEHRLYQVSADDRTVMTMELLSAASFRACNVEDHWSRRETTIRVTYFEPDGASEIKLFHFANDTIFFDGPPKIYAGQGRVLLRGVTADGEQSSRWLLLERLPELLERSRREAPRRIVMATGEAANSGAGRVVVRAVAAAGGL